MAKYFLRKKIFLGDFSQVLGTYTPGAECCMAFLPGKNTIIYFFVKNSGKRVVTHIARTGGSGPGIHSGHGGSASGELYRSVLRGNT